MNDQSNPDWADNLVSMPGDDPKTEPITLPTRGADKNKATQLAVVGLLLIGVIIITVIWAVGS
ncbi:hypothetical protein [Microbacterium sp. MPKO10]|uniref:hypothetical protein n=1 Tax=Microbacterium sp. MPKO10 TaxID=2989818 RepID=UPI002236492B|nr:hypothetical protein [Microbacterium sp. MPKO10]MCW4458159.1 hypothetical protein [Microbacterium sp. MPKO10]